MEQRQVSGDARSARLFEALSRGRVKVWIAETAGVHAMSSRPVGTLIICSLASLVTVVSGFVVVAPASRPIYKRSNLGLLRNVQLERTLEESATDDFASGERALARESILTESMFQENVTFLGMSVPMQFVVGYTGSIMLHAAFGLTRKFIVRPASRCVSIQLILKHSWPLMLVFALSFYLLLSLRTTTASNFLQTRGNEVVYRIHQNGVEQCLFTFLCCACGATWLDEHSALPGDHLLFQLYLFLLGRVLFIVGYLIHPNKRLFGFNLGGFQLNVVLMCYVALRALGCADSRGLWVAIFAFYPPLAHLMVVGALPRLLRLARISYKPLDTTPATMTQSRTESPPDLSPSFHDVLT